MLLLLSSTLFSACSRHNASFVIEECTDQDGTVLNVPVMITMDGVTKNWKPGEAISFPINVESNVKTVSVRARAGGRFVYASQPAFDITPGEDKVLNLRFFRTYTVTVNAVGRNGGPLTDVEVYANDQRIGMTDDKGYFVWNIEEATTRAGTKFDIKLWKGGETAETDPVIISQGVFEYSAGARLALEGEPVEIVTLPPDPPQNDPPPVTRNDPPSIAQNDPPPRNDTPPVVQDDPPPQNDPPPVTRNDPPPVVQDDPPPQNDPPPVTRNDPPPAQTIIPVGATKTLFVDTQPSGQTVVLVNANNPSQTQQVQTPQEIRLQPGYYTWQLASTDSYVPAVPPGTIDLFTRDEDRLVVALRSVNELSAVELGDQARLRGALQDAIDYYSRVPRSDVNAFKEAQKKIGEIYFREIQPRDYQQAIAAFQAILALDNSEYAAHNNLAAVYLEIDAYGQAEDHLDRVLALKHRIPASMRGEIEAEVRYRKGLIKYTLFERETNPDNKFERGLLAQSELQQFLTTIPSGNQSFNGKRQDAQDRINSIGRWIDQNRQ